MSFDQQRVSNVIVVCISQFDILPVIDPPEIIVYSPDSLTSALTIQAFEVAFLLLLCSFS